MKFALSIALLAVAGTAFAQDDSSWTKFGDTDENEWSFRKGSFEITETKAGLEVASMIVQMQRKSTSVMTYRRWYVSTEDCRKGIGKVVVLDTDGSYQYENDYVEDGTSVASSGGTLICLVYKRSREAEAAKSI